LERHWSLGRTSQNNAAQLRLSLTPGFSRVMEEANWKNGLNRFSPATIAKPLKRLSAVPPSTPGLSPVLMKDGKKTEMRPRVATVETRSSVCQSPNTPCAKAIAC